MPRKRPRRVPATPASDWSRLTIKTRRLLLRPYEREDFEAWSRSVQGRRPKQNEFDKGPPPREKLNRRYFGEWLRRSERAREKDLVYGLAVFDRKSGELVGDVVVGVLCRLGYQLGNLGYSMNNQYWGKGYAPEALRGALPAIFKTLRLHRVDVGIEPHNVASIRVAEKAGLEREGIRRSCFHDGKRWLDLFYFVARAEAHGVRKCVPSIRAQVSDYL